MKLLRAQSGNHINDISVLFSSYAASLSFDLSFQNFDRELKELPGEYAPPGGYLLLALEGDMAAGCVALRKESEDTGEMKRLFVRPEFRGRGVGRRLAVAVIDEARSLGYGRIRLDTVSSMREANSLYQSLGFRPIKPYRFNPLEGAVFMELTI